MALNAKSGHALWANSRALALAGITAGTPDPANGQIVRDGAGEPTGVLLEDAMDLVERGIPEPALAEVIDALRNAMAEANRLGLTAVHDFDGPLAFAAHQELDAEGALTWRITKSIPLAHLDEAWASVCGAGSATSGCAWVTSRCLQTARSVLARR